MFYVKLNNREKVIHEITNDTECKVYDFQFYNESSNIVFID